jgi:hypothetical protein
MNTRTTCTTIVTAVAVACLALLPFSTAQAAKIGKNSCGGTDVPNTYCSFEGTGDVTIGSDSCNVVGACTNLLKANRNVRFS